MVTALGGEPVEEPAAGALAVDLEVIEGIMVEGFDVTLRFYGPDGALVAEREWVDAVQQARLGDEIGDHYDFVLRQKVPAGANRLVSYVRVSPGGPVPPPEGPGCVTDVEVPAGDTPRVTLQFGPDAHTGACSSVAAATADADRLLGRGRLPAPGFVGLGEVSALDAAADRGWAARVVARDGESFTVTMDYRQDRVNLVVEDGSVTAAARG